MPNPSRWAAARARQMLQRTRARLARPLGYLEVETPCWCPRRAWSRTSPPSRCPSSPRPTSGERESLYLHTSPEYAMKRLLADGLGRHLPALQGLPQRRGQPRPTTPSSRMLELYRPARRLPGDHGRPRVRPRRGRRGPGRAAPSRIALRAGDGARRRASRRDRHRSPRLQATRGSAHAGGTTRRRRGPSPATASTTSSSGSSSSGWSRGSAVTGRPSSSTTRPRWPPSPGSSAQRPVGGRALRALRARARAGQRLLRAHRRDGAAPPAGGGAGLAALAPGRPAYPLDEAFLEAVGRMPPSGGVAMGLDRVLMLLLGARAHRRTCSSFRRTAFV